MNVLLTGGAGFLGTYIYAELEQAGHRVHAYDRATVSSELSSVAPNLSSSLSIGEIAHLEALFAVCTKVRPDVIVHAAARVGFEPSIKDPLGFYQTNVMGFVNICEVARSCGVRKVLLISSNTACHAGVGSVQKESDPAYSIYKANPSAHYGTSKMITEAIGMSYGQFHDIDFLALRVAAVYGFGMRTPLYIKPMVENSVDGTMTVFETGGRMKRDLTHVSDVSRAVAKAVELERLRPGLSRIINVGAGKLVSPSEIAEIVRRTVPGADIKIGDALTELEEENLKTRVPLDTSIARELLGWTPRFQIEEGIEEYAARYRNFHS